VSKFGITIEYLSFTMPLATCRPDRWDNLPEAVASLPGLYANTMTFSAGPRVRHLSTLTNTRDFEIHN